MVEYARPSPRGRTQRFTPVQPGVGELPDEIKMEIAGWHQDEDHPDLGVAHFQYATADESNRWGITFDHETPSLILWEIVEELLEDVRPTYQYTTED